jgi:hypothetical protein
MSRASGTAAKEPSRDGLSRWLGSAVFHERFGWARIVAAGFVTLGIVVLYLA